MAGKKSIYGIGTLVVVVILFVLLMPFFRSVFAPIFPEGFQDGSCHGKPCSEGKFCMQGACHNNYVPVPKSA